jgi:hypothetical protein
VAKPIFPTLPPLFSSFILIGDLESPHMCLMQGSAIFKWSLYAEFAILPLWFSLLWNCLVPQIVFSSTNKTAGFYL